MEKIEKKYTIVVKALKTLKKSIEILENLKPEEEKFFEGQRDSVIQRFEYSIDSFWKFLNIYMQEKYLTETLGSPRVILRNSLNTKTITREEFDILINCVADRNLTSHAYNEELAEDISNKIPQYYNLMKKIIDKIEL